MRHDIILHVTVLILTTKSKFQIRKKNQMIRDNLVFEKVEYAEFIEKDSIQWT